MKYGIVTFTYGDNYGQRLQNYAVQELLRGYGAQVTTLKQSVPKQSIKHVIKVSVVDLVNGVFRAKRKRHEAFLRFDARHISYETDCHLPDCPPVDVKQFDAFVAGSDQIWSPYIQDDEGSMFLSFAEDVKRVSLSASIAAPEIPEDKVEMYRDRLDSFDSISVREQNAADLIKSITKRDVDVLIDPTLMFDSDFWEGLSIKPSVELPRRYALKYFLGDNSEKVSTFESYCQDESLAIVDLLGDTNFMSLGPSEFLYLVSRASLVATDSFHGSIFSLLFHVPLLIFDRAGSLYDMSDRFDTLAEKMGLGDWRTYNWAALTSSGPKALEIDKQLEKERSRVFAYLNDALR